MAPPPVSRLSSGLITAAAVVIIVAGMKAAAPILVPMLIAIFLAVILTPLFIGLRRRGVPSAVALLVPVIVLVLIASIGVIVVGSSLRNLSQNLPVYQERLQELVESGVELVGRVGVEPSPQALDSVLSANNVMRLVGNVISSLSGALGRTFMILVITVFILLEAALLPRRVRAMPGMTDENWMRMEMVAENIREYVGTKTVVSLLTGFLVWVLLAACGVDYAVLLGLLAFLLDYIPNIGSLMAAIPGILLALLERGPAWAGIVLIGYAVINAVVGNILEPRLVGHRLGLSPMIIVISLVFWGWVLGPLGMLLSVPLTMVVKLALDSIQETRGLAVLLDTSAPKIEEEES